MAVAADLPEIAAEGPDVDDAAVGPVAPKAKRRKVVEHEAAFLEALPSGLMYERSYMHRDTVTQVAVARSAEFFITASNDGHIKFWKKRGEGVEFAKHFRAHVGPVIGLAVSHDSTLLASWATDKSVKVFDVHTYDMMAMLRLSFVPSCAAWIFQPGDAEAKLAIADRDSPTIHVFDIRSGSNDPVHSFAVHRAPLTAMSYNAVHDTVISLDERGVIEYWSGSSYDFPAEEVAFRSTLDTDLYACAKAKAIARTIELSRDGSQFAMFTSDKRVHVWRFATGRLRRTYDESADAVNEVQRAGPESLRLEPIDFGRRQAHDQDLASELAGHDTSLALMPNVIFDESGNFVLYATLLGIKVVNLVANRVARVIGQGEANERFLSIALFQGNERPNAERAARMAGNESRLPGRDPTLMACAFKRQRLYIFSRREPADADDAAGRDVFNEKPPPDELLAIEDGGAEAGAGELPRGAIIHTTRGDIHCKLFPEECPKSIENFTTHARNAYFEGIIFHRVIKGFMVQTGDPLGDGTGGASIWGAEFGDEFSRALRHDRPFTLSMANSGPNTNGSQFFITTVPTPWLDNKHTVFGRVVRGADVVLTIERSKTDRNDKPFDDIKIVNVECVSSVE